MDLTATPKEAAAPSPAPVARKLAKRMAQLTLAAKRFDPNARYSESDVNLILMGSFDDHVFARRLLIEWGFLQRTNDGSSYWLNPDKILE